MRSVKLLMAAMTALLWQPGATGAEQGFFRVADLQPGMKGVGKTCYRGTEPEEFQVEIVGVMHGIGPGADAVLARLSGGPLEKTGVYEGMSGSPVYVNGKLLGAVAFSFPFAKEALAGITPIEQMVSAFEENPDGTTVTPKIILKKSALWKYLRQPAEAGGAGSGLAATLRTQLQATLPSPRAGALTPIATPLSLGGFTAEALRSFEPEFRALGLSVLQGSGGVSMQAPQTAKPKEGAGPVPLQPGSNMVIPLIRGDLDVSAGGTVTYVDGNKIYGFGHPLFNLGFSELPIHQARPITVFPSLQSSFVILEAGDQVGALRQDRGAGVYGLLGQKARMIPMHVEMTTSRGVKRTYNFELASDRFLTPFMVNLTMFNTITVSERALGVSTLEVRGKIRIKGEEPVEIENRFSTDSNSPAFAALSVALPVNFLLASGFENLDFEDIHIEIRALEDDRAALLDSLRTDRAELKVGETLNLTVVCEKANGETLESTYPIRIPADVTAGPLQVLVADGTTIMEMDAREQGEELIPRSLSQLIRFINNIRKNDRLYVRIFRREAGAVVRGEGLPGLPPSILSILRSERSTGSMSPIQTAPLMEYELPPADYVFSGSRLLSLLVKP